jgi:hypothetical protein
MAHIYLRATLFGAIVIFSAINQQKNAKIVLSQELDQIVELISSHQDGIGIDTISQAMGSVMPRRNH